MTRKTFIKGEEFQNDTHYIVESDVYYAIDDTVKAVGPKYLSVSPNELEYLSTCIFLKDKKNITIDFNGHTLFMKGRLQPIIIDNCENITIKNIVTEYDRSFVSELEIAEFGDNYTLLKKNPKTPCKIVDGVLVPYSDTWENFRMSRGFNYLACYDKDGNPRSQILVVIASNPIYDKSLPYVPTEYVAEDAGDFIRLNGPVHDSWRVGDILAEESEPRVHSTLFAYDSKNITIDNCRVLNGSGMAFTPIHTENITFRGIKLIHDERSPGLISNSADVIHSFACSGDFLLEDCEFETAIDDFVNIHGNYLLVDKIINEHTLRAKLKCAGIYAHLNLFDVDDEVSFHKGQSMVTGAPNKITSKDVLDRYTIVFTFEKPLDGVTPGDLIENITGNVNLTIRNCRFSKANNHIRLQTRGKILIENCELEIPIWFTGDADYWFESNPCLDSTIRNCKFLTDKAIILFHPKFTDTEEAPFYHQNVKILNNLFVSSVPVQGNRTNNIEFFGNVNTLGKPMTLNLKKCGNIKADNAEVHNA